MPRQNIHDLIFLTRISSVIKYLLELVANCLDCADFAVQYASAFLHSCVAALHTDFLENCDFSYLAKPSWWISQFILLFKFDAARLQEIFIVMAAGVRALHAFHYLRVAAAEFTVLQ